ncbi:MAG: GAF domain-containing protein, partial [Candidatus Marithrix sp.]|nr:GAF domain-containing protein [Candidatus Marithrix sp.]
MKKLLTISYSIIILGIVTLGILSVLLDKNNHDLFNKQEQRYQSYLLADQLRQSSDDLTRMARTYVVTGDEKYERMYWDILAIRNGKLARPKSYERIYWDLILNYGEKPRLDGETIPLQTLMQQMGINEAEFTKLRISQQNSDDLVIAETIAMNAMKGLYDDGTGNYIKQDEPDYEMAIKIMHNIDYHKYKAKIMQPIDEFLEMLDARTKNSVVEHMAISEFLVVTIEILVVVLIMLALIIAIFVTQRILKQVGGEPAKIAHITKQVATGDLNIKFEENATGIYASIQVMVQNLNIIINDVVRISEGLANGNLNINLQKKYKGDFAKIQHSLTDSITNQNKVVADIIQVSKGLADGDLNIGLQAEYKGDFAKIQHALLVSLSNQREVVADIIKVSKGLAKGDLNIMPEATYRGDFIKIKKALQKTALKLTKTTNKNIQQNWLKTGQTDLSKILQGEQDITSLTKDIITFLCKYVDAQIGLFYLLRDNEQQPYLQVISSHAYVENTDRPDKYLIGEGLIGQAALELKTLYFYQTTKECPAIIRSGLANSIPHHLLVLPCLYQGVVKAVLEIGSNKKLSKIQTKFLEQTLLNIGIAINTASSRTEIQKLLQQSQNQTEELQIQQEKLQKNNEELQSQSEDLQTQSEEMQSQQEELRQTNEVLEERTKDLEQQKIDVQDKNHALEINRIEMEKAQTAIVLKAEELELASKYKSEFLANMSHELRTPLNSLLILSQLLVDNKDGNLVTKQIEYAKTINSAGNDLLTLINDILDLSKVEAGKIEVQWEDVILNNLFTSIEQKFAPIADEKGINFSLKIADNLDPTLRTDSQRIKQIINNLLSNAFKFT